MHEIRKDMRHLANQMEVVHKVMVYIITHMESKMKKNEELEW